MLTGPQFSPAGLDSVRRTDRHRCRARRTGPGGTSAWSRSASSSLPPRSARPALPASSSSERTTCRRPSRRLRSFASCRLTWHFIGQLQANKTRDVASFFDWVHSVDRERIAARLSEQRPHDARRSRCCCRCGSATSPARAASMPARCRRSRSGQRHAAARAARADVHAGAGSRRSGAARALPATARAPADLNRCGHRLDTLSMGMSGDLEAAIAEGATIVRIGTAIFGPRCRGAADTRIAFIGGGNMAPSLIGGAARAVASTPPR